MLSLRRQQRPIGWQQARHIVGDEALQEGGDIFVICLGSDADDGAGKQAICGHG